METYPNTAGLAAASKADLRALGATERQASSLAAAFDLARRAAEHQTRYMTALRQPSDVVAYVRGHMGHLEQETFLVLFLDARQRVIDMREVGVGSLSHVDVHPREVFRDAVRLRAHALIVAHNHPSADPDPSQADLDLTKRLVDAGRLVGIPVLDHLVIGGTEAVSLSALGLVPAAA